MKDLEWWNSRDYNYSPLVTFLIETHNLVDPTVELIRSVRKYPNSEIVVIDDGSMSGHSYKIMDELSGLNEFYLRFNDLFCIITQNRAIPFCRGQYVVKMQDDDKYPDPTWVERAIGWFRRYPELAILGGRRIHPIEEGTDFANPTKPPIELKDFMFVHAVNEAPMWIRRSAFLKIGGFDETYAPMQWGEAELCYRMWLAGYRVAWYPSNVNYGAVKTGTRRGNKRRLETQARIRNRAIFGEKFGDAIPLVEKKIKLFNQVLAQEKQSET